MTIAFCFAILLMPSESVVVTTAGSPSGIAATASEIAILKNEVVFVALNKSINPDSVCLLPASRINSMASSVVTGFRSSWRRKHYSINLASFPIPSVLGDL
jgi:hypothetical protein